MIMPTLFRRETLLDASPEEVFDYHQADGAFERLVPPWESVRIIEHPPGLPQGAHVKLKVRTGPIWQEWIAELVEVRRPKGFRDRQVSGPFKSWVHDHEFIDRPRR